MDSSLGSMKKSAIIGLGCHSMSKPMRSSISAVATFLKPLRGWNPSGSREEDPPSNAYSEIRSTAAGPCIERITRGKL